MKKTASFEITLERLEKIVNDMENGDAELEKSLEMFEEGIKLVKFCSAKLEEAKKKVEILVKDGDKVKLELFKDKFSRE